MTKDSVQDTKPCSKCKRVLPVTAFTRDRKAKSGLSYKCKECIHNEGVWKTDEIRKYRKEYLERTVEKRAATIRKWSERHPDRVRANTARTNKVYRQRHPDAARARGSWKHKHLDPAGEITPAEWKAALEYFNYRCAVCGRPAGLWHKLSADHWISFTDPRPDNPGTVAWNIVPLCCTAKGGEGGCNNRKTNLDPHMWLVRTFGKRQAKVIEDRINAYFESVKPKKEGDE